MCNENKVKYNYKLCYSYEEMAQLHHGVLIRRLLSVKFQPGSLGTKNDAEPGLT